MPYYVYSIHTDSRINRLYGSFDDYKGAEICERGYQGGNDSENNRFVTTIYAENKTYALQSLKRIRREKGLPAK